MGSILETIILMGVMLFGFQLWWLRMLNRGGKSTQRKA